MQYLMNLFQKNTIEAKLKIFNQYKNDIHYYMYNYRMYDDNKNNSDRAIFVFKMLIICTYTNQ